MQSSWNLLFSDKLLEVKSLCFQLLEVVEKFSSCKFKKYNIFSVLNKKKKQKRHERQQQTWKEYWKSLKKKYNRLFFFLGVFGTVFSHHFYRFLIDLKLFRIDNLKFNNSLQWSFKVSEIILAESFGSRKKQRFWASRVLYNYYEVSIFKKKFLVWFLEPICTK